MLRALGGELDAQGFDFTDMTGLLASMDVSGVGAARAASSQGERSAEKAAPAGDDDGLELVSAIGIYRSDAVIRRCPALQAHPLNRGPRVVLHPADARAAGLADGAMAKVVNGAGTATLPVETSDKVAQGAVLVESGHGATAALGAGRVRVEAIR